MSTIMELLEEEWICPINKRQIIEPVLTIDGHSYQRSAIQHWFKLSNKSPKTNLILDQKTLIPNRALYSLKQKIQNSLKIQIDRFQDLQNENKKLKVQNNQLIQKMQFYEALCEQQLKRISQQSNQMNVKQIQENEQQNQVEDKQSYIDEKQKQQNLEASRINFKQRQVLSKQKVKKSSIKYLLKNKQIDNEIQKIIQDLNNKIRQSNIIQLSRNKQNNQLIESCQKQINQFTQRQSKLKEQKNKQIQLKNKQIQLKNKQILTLHNKIKQITTFTKSWFQILSPCYINFLKSLKRYTTLIEYQQLCKQQKYPKRTRQKQQEVQKYRQIQKENIEVFYNDKYQNDQDRKYIQTMYRGYIGTLQRLFFSWKINIQKLLTLQFFPKLIVNKKNDIMKVYIGMSFKSLKQINFFIQNGENVFEGVLQKIKCIFNNDPNQKIQNKEWQQIIRISNKLTQLKVIELKYSKISIFKIQDLARFKKLQYVSIKLIDQQIINKVINNNMQQCDIKINLQEQ